MNDQTDIRNVDSQTKRIRCHHDFHLSIRKPLQSACFIRASTVKRFDAQAFLSQKLCKLLHSLYRIAVHNRLPLRVLLEPAIYFLSLTLLNHSGILAAAEAFTDFDCLKIQIIPRNALTKHLRIVHREMRNDLLHGRRRCSRRKRRDHRTGLQRRDQLRNHQILLSETGALF